MTSSLIKNAGFNRHERIAYGAGNQWLDCFPIRKLQDSQEHVFSGIYYCIFPQLVAKSAVPVSMRTNMQYQQQIIEHDGTIWFKVQECLAFAIVVIAL